MKPLPTRPLACLLCLAITTSLAAQQPAAPAAKAAKPKFTSHVTPEEALAADPDFAIQGEYLIELEDNRWGVQVWARGKGEFEAVSYKNGLPGDGWDGDRDAIVRTPGSREDPSGKAIFITEDGGMRAELSPEMAEVFGSDGTRLFELRRVRRSSPTLGMPPPDGAQVLFAAGGEPNRFKQGRISPDGLLMEGATSLDEFGDCAIHLEFRLPFMPDARGQARGNSGVYLQSRYEVQILDSFGLEGLDNECGGIYKIARPRQNMCLPPLVWQTYDIDFTAPRFDKDGMKTANARITVRHNGELIHDDLELPSPTGGARIKEEGPTGPFFLQNHGNPVRFQNIWVLPKAD